MSLPPGASFEVANCYFTEREVVVLGRLSLDGCVAMAFGSARLSRTTSLAEDLTTAAGNALVQATQILSAVRPRGVGRAASSGAVEAVPPESRVTQKQLGAIQAVVRRQNIAREEVEKRLMDRFGKRELVSLTKAEASGLLDSFATPAVVND